MYEKVFKMCGYSDEEIKRDRPRIEKMLERIGVTTKADIEHAEEWTKINFEVDLAGVRKFLRYVMMNWIDSVLAREENDVVIYYNCPGMPHLSMAVAKAIQEAGKKIYLGPATDFGWMIMGPIFDKVDGLLEKGELLGQPAGRAHCSHYQIHVAMLESGIIPKPDAIWTANYCDQAPCADELAANLLGVPAIHMDVMTDWGFDSWPDALEEHGVKYMAERVRRSYAKIRELTGLEITETHVQKGLMVIGKLSIGFQNLLEMQRAGDPQPIRSSVIAMNVYAAWIWTVRHQYEKDLIDASNTLLRDVKNRIKAGKGVVPKGAPKVYLSMISSSDMRPLNLIEDLGLKVSMMFFSKLFPESLSPSRFKDIHEVISEAGFKIPILFGLKQCIAYWKQCCEYVDADGMILNYMFNCRPLAYQALMGKKKIQEDMGIPVLLCEFDPWDTRNYSVEQLRTRIESFAEMLKMKKIAEAA